MRWILSLFLGITNTIAAQPICATWPKPGELHIPAAEARFRQDLVLRDLPPFCRVVHTLKPRPASSIDLELWLPQQWNGRYLQIGNAGFAGTIHHQTLAHYVALGYAVAGTSNGHRGYDDDTLWSVGQPEKIKDFGYRAVHETAVFAQKALQQHYGTPARSRYMIGCSDGGREGLMEAQRFPEDFDGILAGAPALRWTHGFSALLHVRQVLAALSDPLKPEHIRKISQEVLKQCDAQDGLRDGIIDPSVPCEPKLNGVLSPAQDAAVQAIYQGPKGVHGFRYTQGFEDGPFQWPTWFTGPTMWGAPEPLATGLSFAFFGPMVYQNPKLDPVKLPIQEAIAKADRDLAEILNADHPRLSPSGPKILQYHGWADAAVPAQHSLDYYQKVMQHDPKAANYFRLFMVPGMGHCLTGAGPHIFNGVDNQGAPRDSDHDVLEALQLWVEHGKAPDRIIATQFVDDDPKKPVKRTRPLCPYPQRAKWNGQGDPAQYPSFACEKIQPGYISRP